MEPFIDMPKKGANWLLPNRITDILVPAGGFLSGELPTPAGATFVDALRWTWTRDMWLTALTLHLRSADENQLALLSMRIVDESGVLLTTDGNGTAFQVSCGDLMGGITGIGGPTPGAVPLMPGRKWIIQRRVWSGKQWFYSFANAGGVDVKPVLTYWLGELRE